MNGKTRYVWRRRCIVLALVVTAALIVVWEGRDTTRPSSGASGPTVESAVVRQVLDLPLTFEPNHGQTDPQVDFVARGPGHTLFLAADEAVLRLAASTLSMRIVGGNANAHVEGRDRLPGRVNYFKGNDPAKWRAGIPTYARVCYRDVYPGIDLVYRGNGRRLEYDFVVAPGADPAAIELAFEGMDAIKIDDGELVLAAADGDVRQRRPLLYQEAGGAQEPVDGGFALRDDGRVSFRVGAYDPARPLVIDPVIEYATFLGGSEVDVCYGIAVDSTGNAYVTGRADSLDFPASGFYGGRDTFVTKINAAGTMIIYSTFLGGSSFETGWDIAVDATGNVYVAGNTQSNDFVGTASSSIQSTFAGTIVDGFATKLDVSGAVLYSTYLGGAAFDYAYGIALDSSDNVYVVGYTRSTSFTGVSASSIQPTYGGDDEDGFLVKINSDWSSLAYSTYLGGSLGDTAREVVVDSSGNAYVAGHTESSDFPGTSTSLIQDTFGGGLHDAFVTKVNAAGDAILFSTFLGGDSFDTASSLALGPDGSIYVTGGSSSTNLPGASTSPIQPAHAGGGDGYLAKMDGAGTALAYSTFLGGTGFDTSIDVVVDAAGDATIGGQAISSDFPQVNPIQAGFGGTMDAWVAKVTSNGNTLVYSSYLGGALSDSVRALAIDSAGSVYIGAGAHSTDMPGTAGSTIQPANAGSSDGYIAKLIEVTNAPTLDLYYVIDATTRELRAWRDATIPWVHDKTITLDLVATDADGVTGLSLTGTLEGVDLDTSPEGASFGAGTVDGNTLTRRLTWIPGVPPSGHDGLYDLVFTADDGSGGIDTYTLTLHVDLDTDEDGLPDVWETEGYTYTRQDGSTVDVPLHLMGADPDHKDVFVEIDYMTGSDHDHRPLCAALRRIQDAFAASPVSGNPDGVDGVTLHIKVDAVLAPAGEPAFEDAYDCASNPFASYVEGEPGHEPSIGSGGLSTYNWKRPSGDTSDTVFFEELKGLHFAEELGPAVHYCIFAHKISAGTTGLSRNLDPTKGASDFIVSLGPTTTQVGTLEEQAGTFMHELGHNLGLLHGGYDNDKQKPIYLSVMNPPYQMTGLRMLQPGGSYTEGHFNFCGCLLAPLDESALDETQGVQCTETVVGFDLTKYSVSWWQGPTAVQIWSDWYTNDPTQGLDWDLDTVMESSAPADLNGDNDTNDTHAGRNDWATLDFKGGQIGAGIAIPLPAETPLSVLDEPTYEELVAYQPDGPDKLKGHVAKNKLILTWKPAGPQKDYSYRIYRSEAGGVTVLLATTTRSEYQDTAVTAGVTYSYWVTLIDPYGTESQPSEEVVLTAK